MTEMWRCEHSHELGLHMPRMVGQSWAPEIVIVFWTEQPGKAWIPPCRHREPGDAFWIRLGEAAWKRNIGTLTIVNAGAVLPSQADLQEYERNLTEDADFLRSNELHRSRIFEEMMQDPYDAVDFCFLDMQSWIRTGTGQDVFNPAEMEPWLKSME